MAVRSRMRPIQLAMGAAAGASTRSDPFGIDPNAGGFRFP